MGERPCGIIPAPKRMDVRPGPRAWPSRFEVVCECDVAAPLRERFESDLRAGGSGEPVKLRLCEGRASAGGYVLQFQEHQVVCSASDAAGFRHGLATLMQAAAEPRLPIGSIEDAPRLAVRGIHLNFESYRRMGVEVALRLIDAAGRFKLNAILVEYGPRFPFTAHVELCDPAALSRQDVERLRGAALERGIQIVPLQQCLAHLDYALGHAGLAHLRERPPKTGLMCPSHPESQALFRSLASDIMKLHPEEKWFHLGGDEARKIGECPRCRPIVERDGVGALYGQYVGEQARWLLEQGRRPIVWDDTLCAHPEALDHLPKETIIQYWDYIAVADPTPVLIPRMAHVDGAPRVVHDWRRRLGAWRKGLSDVQIEVMKAYSTAARLPGALGKRFMGEFGRYLGEGFPRWVRALPYLEYYQDRGFEVITSPTGMGNGDTRDGVPKFARFDANIHTHADRCIANGKALGIITTLWYNMPPEVLYQPLIRTAQCAW